MPRRYPHKILVFWFISCLPVLAQAQYQRKDIQGMVIDTAGVPLPGVTVRLASVLDTVSTITGENGTYHFKDIVSQEFRLTFRMIGYELTDRYFQATNSSPQMMLLPVILGPERVLIKEVIVPRVRPIEIRGDTVQYNLAAYDFKKSALLEEVLKGLPGVRVTRDGRVYANGQEVLKVRVDGKVFFGGEVMVATRNLPADFIESVQMIDAYSEMDQQTGIQTGETERIMNIVLKDDSKKILFGQLTGGGGGDVDVRGARGRYIGSIGVNNFNDGQEFSLVSSINNTNTSLFSYGAPTGGGMRERGGGDLTGLIDPVDGVNTVNSIGLTFSDQLSDRIDMYGKYTFVNRNNSTEGNSLLRSVFDQYTIANEEDRKAKTDDYNHLMSWDMEYQMNDHNYLKVSPNLSLNYSNTSNNSINTIRNQDITSIQENTVIGRLSSPSFDMDLLYSKTFVKPERKLVIALHGEYFKQNKLDEIGDSFVTIDSSFTPLPKVDIYELDQEVKNDNNNRVGRMRASFVEPLDKSSKLEVNYEYNYTSISSRRYVLDINNEELIDSLEVDYSYFFQSNRIGVNYQVEHSPKFKYTLGFAFQPLLLRGFTDDRDVVTEHRNINMIPNAGLRYRISNESELTVDYLGTNNQPNFSHIQPVSNHNNAQHIVVGNPDLKAEFINRINTRFRKTTFGKNRFFEASIALTQVQDKIVMTRMALPNTTSQQTSFTNTHGYFDARGYYMYSRDVFGRGVQLNLNGSADYINNVSYINSERNVARNLILSQAANVRFSLEDLLEAELNTSYTVNRAQYSLSSIGNLAANTFLVGMAARSYLSDYFSLGFDISKRINTGYSAYINANPTILNAYMEYTFLRNRMAMIRLQGFDLFDQNTGITRDVFGSDILDMRNNRLSRYFMLSLNVRLQRIPNN